MAFVNDYLLKVDIKRRLANIVPTFAQGETSRLRFKIYDNNVLYDLTDFTRAEIIHKLPSGDSFSADAFLVNGEIVYDYPTKVELGEIGKVEVSLVIYSDKASVSIHPFTIFVYDNFKGENLSYISVLQELIESTQYLEVQVQQVLIDVNQAVSDVNDLKIELNDLIDNVEDAEFIRQTNEISRQGNESTRESNEIQRIANESLRETTFNNKITEVTTKINDFSNAESTRESNELTRIANESLRQTDFTNMKKYAEELKSIGEFNLSTAYKKNNVVLNNGSSWIALQDTQNNPLPVLPSTENTNWRLVAQRGIDGEGSVSQVNGISPDVNGNVLIGISDISNLQTTISNAQQNAITSSKNYTDEQIQYVTETGIPKLVSYKYTLTATVEGQTEFTIPLDTFDKNTDTVILVKNTTVPDEGLDYSISDNVITFIEGVSIGTVISLIILKNVPIGSEGAINASVLADNTVSDAKLMPDNKVGSLATLSTDDKSSAVNAINEIDNNLTSVDTKLNEHLAEKSHVHWIGTVTGTNTLTATFSEITAYEDGLGVSFKNTTDSNAATSLNINGLGAIPILKANSGAVSNLKANGVYTLRYVSGNFILQGEGEVNISGEQVIDAVLQGTINEFDAVYLEGVMTFGKLPNPTTLPTGAGNSIDFSSDGNYLVVGHTSAPCITIYKRSGDVFTKLPNPSPLPTNMVKGVVFSADSTYLAVVHNVSPHLTIYKRSGDTFTALTTPAGNVEPAPNSVDFSPNGDYLAVSGSGNVQIYKRSGDTFTALPKPSGMGSTGYYYGVAFSPSSNYLAVGKSESPFVEIYKRSGDIFTKLANPSVLPTGTGYGIAFSKDEVYLSVAHSASPYITIYKRSGDTFTKLANPSELPGSTARSVSFSANGLYMAVGYQSVSPYFMVYSISGDTFTKIPDTVDPLTGQANTISFSPDNLFMAIAQNTSPYVAIYGTSDFGKVTPLAYKSNNKLNESIVGLGYAKEGGVTGQIKKIGLVWRNN